MHKPIIRAGLSLLLAVTAWGAPLSYVVTLGGDFGILDNANGAFALTACIPADCAIGSAASGIAYGPGGALYIDTSDLGLLKVNPATGQTTVVGEHPGVVFSVFAGLGNGRLFGVSDADGNLYEVNPITAGTSLVSHLFDFADFADTSLSGDGVNLYFTYFAPPDSNAPEAAALYRINPNTGAITLIGPTVSQVQGSAFIDGVLYGYTGYDGYGLAIYKLSLTTGAGTLVSTYKAGDPLFPDLAIYGGVATPEPTTVGMVLSGAAALLVFRRRRV